MNKTIDSSTVSLLPDASGYDPIEDRLRANVRATIETIFEEELAEFLGRIGYGRGDGQAKGYRHGHRARQLTGTFGSETVHVPRARVENEDGEVREWRSKVLPRYQRLTKKAEALIAAVYLAGTNTRRVKRALYGLFEGAVSKHPPKFDAKVAIQSMRKVWLRKTARVGSGCDTRRPRCGPQPQPAARHLAGPKTRLTARTGRRHSVAKE